VVAAKIAGVGELPDQNILPTGTAGGFPFRRLPLAPRLAERIAALPPPIIVFN
jgi:hypothetical protein